MPRIRITGIKAKPAANLVAASRKVILDELTKQAEEIGKLLRKPTNSWSRRVTIKVASPRNNGADIIVDVGALKDSRGNRVYSYANYGTAAHIIKRRQGTGRRRALHFLASYRSSTIPGSLASRASSKGLPWHSAAYVRNRTRARKFDETVLRISKDKFENAMQAPFSKIADGFWQ